MVGKNLAARQRLEQKINRTLAAQFSGVKGATRKLAIPPTYSYPVMPRVSGNSIGQARQFVGQAQAVLDTQPYLRDVNLDWNEKSSIVRLQGRWTNGYIWYII